MITIAVAREDISRLFLFSLRRFCRRVVVLVGWWKNARPQQHHKILPPQDRRTGAQRVVDRYRHFSSCDTYLSPVPHTTPVVAVQRSEVSVYVRTRAEYEATQALVCVGTVHFCAQVRKRVCERVEQSRLVLVVVGVSLSAGASSFYPRQIPRKDNRKVQSVASMCARVSV